MVPLENISDPWITLLEFRVNKLKFPLTPVLLQSRVISTFQMSIEINRGHRFDICNYTKTFGIFFDA